MSAAWAVLELSYRVLEIEDLEHRLAALEHSLEIESETVPWEAA